jgi:hypothetical protein
MNVCRGSYNGDGPFPAAVCTRPYVEGTWAHIRVYYKLILPACLPACLPICLSGSTAHVDLARFFSFLTYTQSVGLLGQGISPSQGRYLHTEQHKHRVNAHIHPCLEWDPSVGAGEDGSCLTPRGHCDRPVSVSLSYSQDLW